MSSKQIRVSSAHYEALKERKRPGESFDDVLARLLEDDRDLLVGFGALTDRPDTRERIEETGEEMDRQMEERAEEIAERLEDEE